jgi:hypothetical protein
VGHGGWTRQAAVGDRPSHDSRGGMYVRSAVAVPEGNTGGTTWPPESGTLNDIGVACANLGQAAQARRTIVTAISARRDGALFMCVTMRCSVADIVYSLSNKSSYRRGCERRYWFGARTCPPNSAAACHGQRGS